MKNLSWLLGRVLAVLFVSAVALSSVPDASAQFGTFFCGGTKYTITYKGKGADCDAAQFDLDFTMQTRADAACTYGACNEHYTYVSACYYNATKMRYQIDGSYQYQCLQCLDSSCGPVN